MPRHDRFTVRPSKNARRRKRGALERLAERAPAVKARAQRKARREAESKRRERDEWAAYRATEALAVGAPVTDADTTTTSIAGAELRPCVECGTPTERGDRCRVCHKRRMRMTNGGAR